MRNGIPSLRVLIFTLARGEVLGLIGDPGPGNPPWVSPPWAYTRLGCRISSGSILFDGQELFDADP